MTIAAILLVSGCSSGKTDNEADVHEQVDSSEVIGDRYGEGDVLGEAIADGSREGIASDLADAIGAEALEEIDVDLTDVTADSELLESYIGDLVPESSDTVDLDWEVVDALDVWYEDGECHDQPETTDCFVVPFETVCLEFPERSEDNPWGGLLLSQLTEDTLLDMQTVGYGCVSLSWSEVATDDDHIYLAWAKQLDSATCICGYAVAAIQQCGADLNVEIESGFCDQPCNPLLAESGGLLFATAVLRIAKDYWKPDTTLGYSSVPLFFEPSGYCPSLGITSMGNQLCLDTGPSGEE